MTHTSTRCIWNNAAKHTGKISAALLLLGLSGTQVMSQPYATTHSFNQVHAKQYSVELLDGTTTTESVMAGTVFTCSASIPPTPPSCVGKVHFLQLDGTTAPIASVVYDHPDYDDERAVDIVPAGGGEYFIICMVRPAPGGSAVPNNRDKIKVLRVDATGSILSEATIYDQTPHSLSWGESLYPTHGIYISGGNGGLFICGYHTPGDTRSGTHTQPNYSDQKNAFVIKLDAATLTLQAARYFSTLPNKLTAAQTKDYDIAMRMQQIMTGPQANMLFVTGSVNAVTGTLGSLYNLERSATMCMVLDPTNLSDVYPVPPFPKPHKHFIVDGNQDGQGRDEYGLHLVEDQPNQANVIVGGHFHNDDGNTTSANYMPGFNTIVQDILVTRLDENYDPVPLWTNRVNITSSNLQPLTVMRSATGPSPLGYCQFMIAGLTSSLAHSTNCFWGGYNEYQPFLVDLEVRTDKSNFAQISPANWYRYPTTSGTAGYHGLGGGLSSAWLTTNATRMTINDPILMTGPRLTGSGLMGLRTLTTTSSTIYGTDCDVSTCEPLRYDFDIIDPDVTQSNPIPNIMVDQETTSAITLSYHTEACSTANKQATVIENIPLKIPVLAPNPATTEIKITGVEKGNYNIFDMVGRKILSGTFSEGATIDIAKLAAATYTAEIIADGLSTKTKFIKQ